MFICIESLDYIMYGFNWSSYAKASYVKPQEILIYKVTLQIKLFSHKENNMQFLWILIP